jgi:chromate transporter
VSSTATPPAAPPTQSLPRLFVRFLRFGFLAWGGPVAQIAMLRRELVEDERWIDGPRFNRLLALYQVLPGPEAHELAVHLGFLRGRRLGGLLAGLGFMLPGFGLMLLLAQLYVTIDLTTPTIAALLLGAQVGVVALIVRGIERIARHVVVDRASLGIAVSAALATVAGASFLLILPLAGVLYVAARARYGRVLIAGALVVASLAAAASVTGWLPGEPPTPPTTGGDPGSQGVASVPDLFLSGLRAGLLTFGGAYTAIPFLRQDAVGRGWLTDGQFLDGIALSGILPAPLIIFSTFVGFIAGGLAGGIAMTVGVFLPAFAFGLLFGTRLERVVEEPRLHRFLEGVAAGVVGLIVVTAIDLAVSLAGRLPSPALGAALALVALLVLFRWPSRWAIPVVMAGCAAAGWLLFGIPA